MSLLSWYRSNIISLEEESLFTGRVYIHVEQQGIAKTVVVRTKKNGGIA